MGFTNHTTNYEFGQYVGTDIPSYLTDWNDTMSQIDTAIKNTADSASGLSSRLSAVEAQQTLDVADIAQAKSDITTNATAITTEAADRAAADTSLSVRVGANESAITALQGDVTALAGQIGNAANPGAAIFQGSGTSYIDFNMSDLFAGATVTTQADTLTGTVTADGTLRYHFSIIPGAIVKPDSNGELDVTIYANTQINRNSLDVAPWSACLSVLLSGTGNTTGVSVNARQTGAILETFKTAVKNYINGGTLYYNGETIDLSQKTVTLTGITNRTDETVEVNIGGTSTQTTYSFGSGNIYLDVLQYGNGSSTAGFTYFLYPLFNPSFSIIRVHIA